jgi:hypothetical protein
MSIALVGVASANDPAGAASNPTTDAAAAVAGGGKASYWSRDNARLSLAGSAVAAPRWAAEVNADDSRLAFTQEEQDELVQHLRDALERLVALPSVPAQVGALAAAAPGPAVTLATPLRLQARITQASMPNITRNLLVMALPIPVPGVRSLLRSRGGASIEVALLRPGETEPAASFVCDHQVGLISVLDSYRRLAQAKTAMDRCADTFARSAAEGRLVDASQADQTAER